MDKFLILLQKTAPEMIELLERRYTILRSIYFLQPIGRRLLAYKLDLPERLVRNEVEFFREQGLVHTGPAGMCLVPESQSVLNELGTVIYRLRGLHQFEEVLTQRLGICKTIIVPGNADLDELVKKEIGRVAARYLKLLLHDNEVLAVTGGSTVAAVAEALVPGPVGRKVWVVPARGGLGEKVETQANTIAALIAKNIQASYRMLHVPDNLSEDVLERLLNDPQIREVVDTIKATDILIHGIGRAETIARSRRTPEIEIKRLLDEGAVGEAFGYYFDRNGRIVHAINTIGLRLDDLAQVNHIVAVAGGEGKAEAIMAVSLRVRRLVLIIDEGAARRIGHLTRPGKTGPDNLKGGQLCP